MSEPAIAIALARCSMCNRCATVPANNQREHVCVCVGDTHKCGGRPRPASTIFGDPACCPCNRCGGGHWRVTRGMSVDVFGNFQ